MAKFSEELLYYLTRLHKQEQIRLIHFLFNLNDEQFELWKTFPKDIQQELVDMSADDLPEIIRVFMHKYNGRPIPSRDALEIVISICKHLPNHAAAIKEKVKDIYLQTYDKPNRNLDNLTYLEAPPPLTRQLFRTKISRREFMQLTRQGVDISDYIVLAGNLLSQTVVDNKSIPPEFNLVIDVLAIQDSYLSLEYETSLALIRQLCRKLQTIPKLAGLARDVFTSLEQVLPLDPKQDHTRRAFETYLSQYMMGDAISDDSLASIAKIASYFGYNLKSSYNLDFIVAAITNTTYSEKIYKRHQKLKLASQRYQQRIRVAPRQGFLRNSDEKTKGHGESSLSRNTGLFKANTPTFPEHRSRYNQRNRLVDIQEKNISLDHANQGSEDRAIPVASVSGHAFYMVAMLEHYMRHSRSLSLQKDISHFINAYVAVCTRLSYHSMFEIMDVLHEPVVKSIFYAYGVNQSLILRPEIFEWAFNDALAYTKLMLGKGQTNRELLEKVARFPQTKSKKKPGSKHPH